MTTLADSFCSFARWMRIALALCIFLTIQACDIMSMEDDEDGPPRSRRTYD